MLANFKNRIVLHEKQKSERVSPEKWARGLEIGKTQTLLTPDFGQDLLVQLVMLCATEKKDTNLLYATGTKHTNETSAQFGATARSTAKRSNHAVWGEDWSLPRARTGVAAVHEGHSLVLDMLQFGIPPNCKGGRPGLTLDDVGDEDVRYWQWYGDYRYGIQ